MDGAPCPAGPRLDGDFCGMFVRHPTDKGSIPLESCTDSGGGGGGFIDPGHRWNGGRLGVGVCESGGDSSLIAHEAFGAPMDVTVPVFPDFAGEIDLVGDFRCGASGIFGRIDSRGRDAGPNGTAALAAPPVEEGGETLLLRGNAPVELRREVVDPAIFQPFSGVSGELFVGIQAGLDSAGNARAPNAERADSDTDPGFLTFYGRIEIADEVINIGATLGRGFAIGKAEVPGRIGVKIVVEMNAIDVVTSDHIENDVEGAAAGIRVGGIAPDHGAKAFGDVGRGSGDVVRCGFLRGVGKRAKGVEPSVHFDAAGMGFTNAISERVVAG